MCDILVATPAVTREGVMLFAKNSDRDPNEAQVLERHPRLKPHEPVVQLTYTSFPQAEETYSTIMSRPWWMWGAEMGANEHGVVIGNTAVFTRIKVPKTGLLGMDILRLALERTRTASEALAFIVSIVETIGQGGNCSYEHRFRYHNTFIIADPTEAWVIETVDKHWVALRIREVYSVSNALTIEDQWDLCSESVEKLRQKHENFSFARYFSDRLMTKAAHGRKRRSFTYNRLLQHRGIIDATFMAHTLQMHHREPFLPHKASTRDICMHFNGPLVPSQTASSQLSILTPANQQHWFTACSNPCLSLFKPVSFTKEWPELGPPPTAHYHPDAYWWRMEAFHRKLHTVYQTVKPALDAERTALQQNWFDDPPPPTEAFMQERQWVDGWDVRIRPARLPFPSGLFWHRANQKAHLVLTPTG